MMIGGPASQDWNLTQVSKVSKEKPTHKKKPHQVWKPFLNASGDIQKIITIMNIYIKKNYKFINQIISRY